MKSKYFNRALIGFVSMIISFGAFGLGLWFPIISTKKSILSITLKYQEVRVTDSVKLFFESGDYLLAVIIALFVIVVPIIKYIDLIGRHKYFDKQWKYSKFLIAIDKWSMIDVFLVALLVLNFKMNSNIIVMKLELGTTFITLSVIFRIIATIFLKNDKYNC